MESGSRSIEPEAFRGHTPGCSFKIQRRATVARIERSEIRDSFARVTIRPGCRCASSGPQTTNFPLSLLSARLSLCIGIHHRADHALVRHAALFAPLPAAPGEDDLQARCAKRVG